MWLPTLHIENLNSLLMKCTEELLSFSIELLYPTDSLLLHVVSCFLIPEVDCKVKDGLKCISLLPGTEDAGSFPHHVGTVLAFRVGQQCPIYR